MCSSLESKNGNPNGVVLSTHQPEELGVRSPLWTRRAVVDLIEREFALVLAVRTVGRCLTRWGFTTKRPRRRSRDQDPGEVEEWLEETYPDVAERAEREGAAIYWGDETGAADRLPAVGYAPRGEPATIDAPDRHVRASQISAVSNSGEVRFMTYARTMNAELFLVFLERLPRGATGTMFLIVDRLRPHMTPEVQEWATSRRDRIEVFYLPRYAPEVNPGEYLNNDLKDRVNKAGLPPPISPVCRGH